MESVSDQRWIQTQIATQCAPGFACDALRSRDVICVQECLLIACRPPPLLPCQTTTTRSVSEMRSSLWVLLSQGFISQFPPNLLICSYHCDKGISE